MVGVEVVSKDWPQGNVHMGKFLTCERLTHLKLNLKTNRQLLSTLYDSCNILVLSSLQQQRNYMFCSR